jgi:hypothetical protein
MGEIQEEAGGNGRDTGDGEGRERYSWREWER